MSPSGDDPPRAGAVAVLGAGRWGVLLAGLAAASSPGREVLLWSRAADRRTELRRGRRPQFAGAPELPANVQLPDSLEESLRAPLVFVAVPPAWVRSLLKEAAEALRPEQELVHAVKGVEPGGATVSRVIEEESCVIRTGALAGPLVPEDLWRGEDGAAVLGSRFQSVLDAATAVLGGPHLRVYRTRDLRGVEIGGAMRTPVGLAAGMLRGAGAGKALLAVLLTRALAEAGRLATALGADRQTLSGLSGIGDWMLTAQEESDELLQAGMRVARGMPLGHDEAASRVRTLMELARERRVELPITGAVGAVLEGVPLREALGALMSRAARSEGE